MLNGVFGLVEVPPGDESRLEQGAGPRRSLEHVAELGEERQLLGVAVQAAEHLGLGAEEHRSLAACRSRALVELDGPLEIAHLVGGDPGR
ncbi:MAG: hypothetical protein AAF211_07280, partial [Myxococcota bacterium]